MSVRLPHGQQMAAPNKWPSVGERTPRVDARPWTVELTGEVAQERRWNLEDLRAMPQVERVIDIHCVTRWSKLGVRLGGVPLAALLEEAEPTAHAKFVSFVARSERGHSTSLVLRDALDLGALIVLTVDGTPLDELRGGPVRVVVPERYFYKSLKWLERIELLAADRLGFWEATAGYHNIADVALEQRYIASDLSKAESRAVLEQRDIAGRELLSLSARDRDLTGLNARKAILRAADFQNCSLNGACFDGANLTNAHFCHADLRGASFRDTELAGADLSGADLRGADLRGAGFFGASFCQDGEPAHDAYTAGAVINRETQIDLPALAELTPVQHAYVKWALIRAAGG